MRQNSFLQRAESSWSGAAAKNKISNSKDLRSTTTWVSKIGLAALDHGSVWCWSAAACRDQLALNRDPRTQSRKPSTDQSLLSAHTSITALWQRRAVSNYLRNQATRRSATKELGIFQLSSAFAWKRKSCCFGYEKSTLGFQPEDVEKPGVIVCFLVLW